MQNQASKKIYISLTIFLILSWIGLGYALATDTPINPEDLPIPTQIQDLDEQINSNVSPKFPKPGEDVTITLSAFGTDLNTANIIWSVNDIIVKQGKGQKVLVVNAGKSGEITNVKVDIEPKNSKIITKTFTINPQTVDILWEARTYTPPFYKGKSMFTPEERVVFVAMPNINGLNTDPKTLVYKWTENQTVQGDKSGYGQNTFVHQGDILMKPVEIGVEATSEDGSKAFNNMYLSSVYPENYLYENSPLYGILFNREVSGTFMFEDKEERTLSVFPYFIGASNRLQSNLSYIWSVNYNTVTGPENQKELTFRNTSNLEGKSFIDVITNNKNSFLQKAETTTYIDFQKLKKAFEF